MFIKKKTEFLKCPSSLCYALNKYILYNASSVEQSAAKQNNKSKFNCKCSRSSQSYKKVYANYLKN